MLKWKENPVDAFNRQIEEGRAVQLVAAQVLSQLAKQGIDISVDRFLALSKAMLKGAELERDGIREKIELYGDQQTKRSGTQDWCIEKDEKDGWAAAKPKRTECDGQDECCCDEPKLDSIP